MLIHYPFKGKSKERPPMHHNSKNTASPKPQAKITGGQLLVDCLSALAVEKIFCVAGESYLAALDALYDTPTIQTITCRQEGGAGFMAEAYAKLTGKLGVSFVTRGPGATNASIAVHTAMQDSTPLLLLVGQVARPHLGREAFQEVDYQQFFKPPFTKGVFEIHDPETIPDIMQKAATLAQSGRKGPVVISLPEDMLAEEISGNIPSSAISLTPSPPAAPSEAELTALKSLLAQSRKPLLILGGSGWTTDGLNALEAFALHNHIPTLTTFRRQDIFNNAHPCYAGCLGTTVDPKLLAHVRESDLIIAFNTRLSEIATNGYDLITIPKPKQIFIHLYPDASELNRVYHNTLGIVTHLTLGAKALSALTLPDNARFTPWLHQLRADYISFHSLTKGGRFVCDVDDIFKIFLKYCPEDAIITTDAGNFSGWAQRYISYHQNRRLLAPTSGAMGYGVPSAIAAALTAPNRTVVGMMGDGGFQMSGQELATALKYGAKPILLVFNNGIYGTIRMHQEMHYKHRPIATDLANPHFAHLANAYGLNGTRIEKSADFEDAFIKALKADRLSLIEIMMDTSQITTAKTLADL
jgi:acetolactate synthase-1/2/3 large subunit